MVALAYHYGCLRSNRATPHFLRALSHHPIDLYLYVKSNVCKCAQIPPYARCPLTANRVDFREIRLFGPSGGAGADFCKARHT